MGETANTWLWHDDWLDKSNPRDAALTDYTGTMRLEVPDDITNGCSIAVTCYPDIREHKAFLPVLFCTGQNTESILNISIYRE